MELADGTEVEGILIVAPDDYVSVGIGGSAVRRIATSDIRRVMLAVPDRRVELALAVVGILVATLALVGLASLPIVGPYLMTHAMDGFGVVFYACAVGCGVLLARTGLRSWLTRWRELYVAGDA